MCLFVFAVFFPRQWALRKDEFWVMVLEFCPHSNPCMPGVSKRTVNPFQTVPDKRNGSEKVWFTTRVLSLSHRLCLLLSLLSPNSSLFPSRTTWGANPTWPAWGAAKAAPLPHCGSIQLKCAHQNLYAHFPFILLKSLCPLLVVKKHSLAFQWNRCPL